MNAYTEIQKLAGWINSDQTSPFIVAIVNDILSLDYTTALELFESRCDIPVREAIEG